MRGDLPSALVSGSGSALSSPVVFVFGILIGTGLVALASLTLGLSVLRGVKNRRRARVRGELQDEMLDRLFDPETDWSEWVEGLSGVEREVTEDLLEEYIRELDGETVETLRRLGAELGIPDRSAHRLTSRREYRRLYALTWLALLGQTERLRTVPFQPETDRERAAVARMRRESDDFEDTAEGLGLLLDEKTTRLSVFGQDTLYQVALADPGTLFELVRESYQTWSTPLLVQVLVVCRHVGTNVSTEDLSWLITLLEHDDETVREAATLVLGNFGWRRDIRNPALVTRLLADPSSRVRAAVYRMLTRWGDTAALEQLGGALQTEDDPRARLAGTDALAEQREQFPVATAERLDQAWLWSKEQAEYDRLTRTPGSLGSG